MKKYIILDTEETRDFCKSLIGSTCIKLGEEINNSTGTIFWRMETEDGELVFLESELKEVL